MYFKSIQASVFKSLFEVLKDIINDVNIYFDELGMRLIAFDIARVTLVHVTMDAENFEEYSCKNPAVVGVNIGNIFRLIKSIGTNDVITFELKDEILCIIVQNETKKTKSKYNIKLLDLNEDELELPEIPMLYQTNIPSIDFQKLIRDMSNIGPYMTIERKDSHIKFTCKGDYAEQETVINQIESIEEPSIGVFNVKYLSMFTKGTILCPIVQILQNPSDSSPIIFKYSIANLGEIKFYLAPTCT
jgi:proliferating cell nuclear antigen